MPEVTTINKIWSSCLKWKELLFLSSQDSIQRQLVIHIVYITGYDTNNISHSNKLTLF